MIENWSDWDGDIVAQAIVAVPSQYVAIISKADRRPCHHIYGTNI